MTDGPHQRQDNEDFASTIQAEILLEDPLFRDCDRVGIARLLNNAARLRVGEGEWLYRQGDTADHIYLIEKGWLALQRGEKRIGMRQKGAIGLEGVVGYAEFRDDAKARTDVTLISIPVSELSQLAEGDSKVLKGFFAAYDRRFLDRGAVPKIADSDEKGGGGEGKGLNRQLLGWLLAILFPLPLYLMRDSLGVTTDVLLFLGIIGEAVIMWVFDLVPPFVPPLFTLLLVVLLEVAPARVALSGFSSGTFILCLSVFGISALMIKSGLAYRLSIGLLRRVPKGRIWYSFSLFMVGVFLTPLVPSKAGRISILQPFLIELMNLGDRGRRNDTATQFVTSAVLGISLMSPIFLTGSAMNLVMFGLFDEQTRFTFNWLYWLFVASLPGLLLMAGYLLLMWALFRDGRRIELSKEKLKEQGRALGGMSALEMGTLITLVCMVILIPTVKFHRIEIPWLMLTISVILLLFGVIGNRDFKNGIDWPILVFIGAVLAWPGVISMIGMDDLIAELLEPVGWYMKNEFFLFAILLSLAMMGLRLFLPYHVAVVVFATTLMPVANESGVSPWAIGFIILMMAEASVFAYQDIQRVQAESALELHGLAGVVNEGKANLAYLIMAIMRMAVILASIPIWMKLDII